MTAMTELRCAENVLLPRIEIMNEYDSSLDHEKLNSLFPSPTSRTEKLPRKRLTLVSANSAEVNSSQFKLLVNLSVSTAT